MVVVVGFLMNGANFYGYVRCKYGSKEKMTTMARTVLTTQFIKSVSLSQAVVVYICVPDLLKISVSLCREKLLAVYPSKSMSASGLFWKRFQLQGYFEKGFAYPPPPPPPSPSSPLPPIK